MYCPLQYTYCMYGMFVSGSHAKSANFLAHAQLMYGISMWITVRFYPYPYHCPLPDVFYHLEYQTKLTFTLFTLPLSLTLAVKCGCDVIA